MSNDIDDVLRDMMANPPKKPQPPKAEVFSSPERTPEPEPAVKPQKRARKQTEEDTPDIVYRTVPKLTFMPTCGTCRVKLKAGDKHWYYGVGPDRYWWCTKCMRVHCNTYPPEEEPQSGK